MAYPEFFVAPMREELTRLGIEELRTPAQVDEALSRKGTTLLVVNSICGCAAGRARPAIAEAVNHLAKPDHMTTVFAGADLEATARAREYLTGYPPSSPSVAILRDGQLVWMMERRQIESQGMDAIVRDLTSAFDQYCAKETADRVNADRRRWAVGRWWVVAISGQATAAQPPAPTSSYGLRPTAHGLRPTAHRLKPSRIIPRACASPGADPSAADSPG